MAITVRTKSLDELLDFLEKLLDSDLKSLKDHILRIHDFEREFLQIDEFVERYLYTWSKELWEERINPGGDG